MRAQTSGYAATPDYVLTSPTGYRASQKLSQTLPNNPVYVPSELIFSCENSRSVLSAKLKVSGLKPGQKYLYRVCAENAAGVSDPAEQLGPLLADDPHGETHLPSFS